MEQFSRTISLFGKTNFIKLQNAKVAVVGIGGVGSFAVETLARAGIGNLIIIDNDKIERSNINRQLWALNSTVGMYKVDVAYGRLMDINPKLKLKKYNLRLSKKNVEKLIPDNIDFVVDAIDSLTNKTELLLFCVNKGIPVISCMGFARRIDPTKIKIGKFNDTTITGPLIKNLRKKIKKEKSNINFPIVYSTEIAMKLEKGQPLSSWCATTGAAGLTAASYICKKIINKPI